MLGFDVKKVKLLFEKLKHLLYTISAYRSYSTLKRMGSQEVIIKSTNTLSVSL